ncbi:MAG: SMC-Scp complex subunit ScpB [Akkermansiaceae bacterium]|nr:SMC-Scp complex subunit ScpB [Armatimonadota bacterium]
MLTSDETARVIEALLFASGDPLTVKELVKATDTDTESVEIALRNLRDQYSSADSALQVVEIANGFQLATRSEYASYIGKLLAPHANRLSKPALETATIVAYRQPCTQAEIEAVRGVGSDGVLKTLVERELITEAGRKQAPGRPLLYVTTPQFLHYFGLASLAELPALEDDSEADAVEQDAAQTALLAAGVETGPSI